MANFTCDICGGTIKMQGSQGGVCQTCGMEYDLEAIRAKVNAAPQPNIETSVVELTPQNNQQDALDRQALLIYLNDLRTMETILYESPNKRKRIAEKGKTGKKIVEQVQKDYLKIERYADDINNQSEDEDYLHSLVHQSHINRAIFMICL